MKPERRFRQSITKHLKSLYVWPINDSYHAGVPDHYYSGTGGDLWAEYKYFPTDRDSFDLTKPDKTPKLTVRQQTWLNHRYDEGRQVWVIVGMPSGGVILMDKEWLYPVKVQALLDRKQIAQEILRVTSTYSSINSTHGES
jgi:hypothetical protein